MASTIELVSTPARTLPAVLHFAFLDADDAPVDVTGFAAEWATALVGPHALVPVAPGVLGVRLEAAEVALLKSVPWDLRVTPAPGVPTSIWASGVVTLATHYADGAPEADEPQRWTGRFRVVDGAPVAFLGDVVRGVPGQDGGDGAPGVVAAAAPLAYNAGTQTVSLAPGTAAGQRLRWDGLAWVPVVGVPWADLSGVPAAFPPSAHRHPYGDLDDVPATFAPSAHNHAWGDITGKPATFAPSAHQHAPADLTQAGAAAGQALVWSGAAWVPGTVAAAPGGASGQLQVNNGGAFAGAAGLTWTPGTGRLGVLSTDTGGEGLYLTKADGTALPVARREGTDLNVGGPGWAWLRLFAGATEAARLTPGGARFGPAVLSVDAGLAVSTIAAGRVGIVSQAVSGQTANLQEWRNSVGSAVATVGSTGVLTSTVGISTAGYVLAPNVALAYGGTGVKTVSSGMLRWAAPGSIDSATDAALGRASAGVVEVNGGTAGTLRDLSLRTLMAEGLQMSAAGSAPAAPGTVAAWLAVTVGGTSYRLPLYL